ncbi:MAG: YbhB/YbcL family Raf kinase inhibitor-like protein [Gemmatimonadaceae bacterium]|jgi:hypothetical protein|nr:YbhB/YbcL family Raf kinase inhibitor-like protein [Gemmatimonadaceae bacterium]
MRISRSLCLLVMLASSLAAQPRAARFALTSAELSGTARIPDAHVFTGFGCSGGNVSPSLSWSNAPAGTKSFALTMYDPDAPTGSGWWHWVVYNIPATTTSLAAGAGSTQRSAMPAGAVQGRTDFGSAGYGGPCPPAGDRPHRYIFTIFALKVDKLELPESATAALIGFNVRANTLAQAEFTAMYGR